jgi:hypothetical protein
MWIAAALAAGPVEAQTEQSLLERDPYDELTVVADDKTTTLEVQFLNLPRQPIDPTAPPNVERPQFELANRPGEAYEVEWVHVRKIRLHEEIVLSRAEELASKRDFDEAFEHLDFLRKKSPEWPGLESSIQRFLFEHGQRELAQGHLDRAYIIWTELYARNQGFPGLREGLGQIGHAMIEVRVRAEDFAAARLLIDRFSKRFGERELSAVTQWSRQFQSESQSLLEGAKAALADNRLTEAFTKLDRAAAIWPDVPGLEAVKQSLRERYPAVSVGVSAPAPLENIEPLISWEARRARRLTCRQIFEFLRPGPEGGEYTCPLASVEWDDTRRQLVLNLPGWTDAAQRAPSIRGSELARAILQAAEDEVPRVLGDYVDSVRVRDVQSVFVSFREHVRPEALLDLSPAPRYSSASPTAEESPCIWQPYSFLTRDGRGARFIRNPGYNPGASLPAEIVERTYSSPLRALAALQTGEIQVLDQVAPWLVEKASQEANIVVEKYAAPTLHVLLPNYDRPLAANRTLRRALVYGIPRRAILLNDLLSGRAVAGCEVIDGPFPPGESIQDPLRYAFNVDVPIREYEPALAMTLVRVAVKQISPERSDADALQPCVVTIAHPPDDLSRTACRAIQRELKRVGVEVQLVEIPPTGSIPATTAYDFRYAQVSVWEPAVDAVRLLGRGGPADSQSPHVLQAIAALRTAGTWSLVRERLRRIHEIVHREVTFIPLWQIVDHFAYRQELTGVGSRPAVLYQNVEDWRLTGISSP